MIFKGYFPTFNNYNEVISYINKVREDAHHRIDIRDYDMLPICHKKIKRPKTIHNSVFLTTLSIYDSQARYYKIEVFGCNYYYCESRTPKEAVVECLKHYIYNKEKKVVSRQKLRGYIDNLKTEDNANICCTDMKTDRKFYYYMMYI